MGDIEIFLVIEAILLGRRDCHSNVTSKESIFVQSPATNCF
jgi:hypothetical protein